MLFGVASRTFVLLASMFICMYACVGIGNALVSTYSVNKPMAGDEDASVSRSAVCTSRLGDSWKEGGGGERGFKGILQLCTGARIKTREVVVPPCFYRTIAHHFPTDA